MNDLTIKQENFCLKYIECGNASEAYRFAYSVKKMKDETIHEASSRLIADYKVSTRVKDLQEENKKRSDITTDQKKDWLKEVIERSLQHKEVTDHDGEGIGEFKFGASDVIRAVNELNKMDGDHSPVKQDINGDIILALKIKRFDGTVSGEGES
ncbi:MAG: terminase [Methylophaga sp.]|nr:MAG: terminase [Methylophaga sp.]